MLRGLVFCPVLSVTEAFCSALSNDLLWKIKEAS